MKDSELGLGCGFINGGFCLLSSPHIGSEFGRSEGGAHEPGGLLAVAFLGLHARAKFVVTSVITSIVNCVVRSEKVTKQRRMFGPGTKGRTWLLAVHGNLKLPLAASCAQRWDQQVPKQKRGGRECNERVRRKRGKRGRGRRGNGKGMEREGEGRRRRGNGTLTPRDCTDVEAVNITVEQPRAEAEKKARRTSWKLRRQLSVFGHEHRTWKDRHPCVVKTVVVLLGGLGLGLYFFDVVTDVLLTKTFFQYGHPGWGWMTVTFVAVPYLVAAVGVFNYYLGANSVRWENDEGAQNRRKRVVFLLFPLWMPACAAMPLAFDVLMPFNFIVGAHLSDSLSNFLVQYEATRVLAETILESIPQMLLQIFIFVYCGNDDARHRGWEPDHVPGLNHTAPSPTTSPPGQCGGVTREGQDALTMSLIASVLSIVYRFTTTWLEMKRMK